MARRSSCRVAQRCWLSTFVWTSDQKLSMAALMLLYLSSGDLEGWSGFADGAHGCPEFAGEESFQAADDLGLRLSFGDAAGDVKIGRASCRERVCQYV